MNLASFSVNVSSALDLRIASALVLALVLYLRWEHDNRQGEQRVYTVTGAHAEADAQETTGLGWSTES